MRTRRKLWMAAFMFAFAAAARLDGVIWQSWAFLVVAIVLVASAANAEEAP